MIMWRGHSCPRVCIFQAADVYKRVPRQCNHQPEMAIRPLKGEWGPGKAGDAWRTPPPLRVQARASSARLRGTIRATRSMTFLFCADLFRS
jgi:hypothetical protein